VEAKVMKKYNHVELNYQKRINCDAEELRKMGKGNKKTNFTNNRKI
jgi:hypothetical protein